MLTRIIAIIISILALSTIIPSSSNFYASVTTVVKSAGIGIAVGQLYDEKRKDRKGRIVILEVFGDSPGEQSGLEKGDIITHIDGKATKGRKLDAVILNLLKGEPGTTVELKVYRTNPGRLINIYVIRDHVDL